MVLAGTRNVNPLNQIYFLQADTGRIPGAPQQARWTLWNSCETSPNGRNDCTFTRAAYPFDPRRNFASEENVPVEFLGSVRRDDDDLYLGEPAR